MEILDCKESSNLLKASYDPETEVLRVSFKDVVGQITSTYEYEKFTVDEWQALKEAPSKGKHFAKYTKPKYAKDSLRFGLYKRI